MRNICRKMLMCSALVMAGCSASQTQSQAAGTPGESAPRASVPAFAADSAYAYVAAQTAFGPRVPGTEASRQCAEWIVGKLREFGASDITEQRGQVTAYNGDVLDICNISARLNPQATKRIMLLAHYDTRPWADQDADPTRRMEPIDGANDGASGVGVILEVARQISKQAPKVGVDVLFVDAEDYGRRDDDDPATAGEDSWCLGTQYWTANPTIDPWSIQYAILLDMVGGKDACFPREYFSEYTAKDINDLVGKAAVRAGQGHRFPATVGAPVLDDHIYLNQAGIRAIDIIENAITDEQSFNSTWHTHADNISNIDPATLGAVGQTIMELIY